MRRMKEGDDVEEREEVVVGEVELEGEVEVGVAAVV